MTKLEQDVAIFVVFKIVLELTNVTVFQRTVNFNLGLELQERGAT